MILFSRLKFASEGLIFKDLRGIFNDVILNVDSLRLIKSRNYSFKSFCKWQCFVIGFLAYCKEIKI